MATVRIVEVVVGHGSTFIKDGPECKCGYHQWIVKSAEPVCSQCGAVREGSFTGYVKDGPECHCGYHQWFVSPDT
jgi:hypothetical protein